MLSVILLAVAHASVLRDSCDARDDGGCASIPGSATEAASLMEYRQLGRSGLLVSRLSYGAWITFSSFTDTEAYHLMRLCVDAGINFFDNAEAYNDGLAEEVMGRALKRLEIEYPLPRSRVVVTTKIFFGTDRGNDKPGRWVPNSKGLSRKHIMEGLAASLRRLQVDYVDVVFAHRPDPHTPMEEVVRAFNHVIDRGLAFYWCTSEWSAAELKEAYAVADRLNLVGPVCEQPQYSMLQRQRFEGEYRELYDTRGLGTTIWSSLSSGTYLEVLALLALVRPVRSQWRAGLQGKDVLVRASRTKSKHTHPRSLLRTLLRTFIYHIYPWIYIYIFITRQAC